MSDDCGQLFDIKWQAVMHARHCSLLGSRRKERAECVVCLKTFSSHTNLTHHHKQAHKSLFTVSRTGDRSRRRGLKHAPVSFSVLVIVFRNELISECDLMSTEFNQEVCESRLVCDRMFSISGEI